MTFVDPGERGRAAQSLILVRSLKSAALAADVFDLMSTVDYRLLERWEASQRWRQRARERDAPDDGVEELLMRALRHLDRRRVEALPSLRRLELDDR